MRHASFVIERDEVERLVIRDMGLWDRLTVTHDAEYVVESLSSRLPAGRRLFYYDSEDMLDEIRHDGAGHFLGFVPGQRRER